jgi:PHD/YefM family antitoxin component YafN of YafNO toxin-antitoxin module
LVAQAWTEIVTRHGEEVAVIIDAAEFHRMTGETPDFKDYLRSGPPLDDPGLTRAGDLPREIHWGPEE